MPAGVTIGRDGLYVAPGRKTVITAGVMDVPVKRGVSVFRDD